MISCTHKDQVRKVTPSAKGCEDCLKTGDSWVICGCAWYAVTLAAATPRRTSTRLNTSIPAGIRSYGPLEPGEAWAWCYVDEEFFETV